MLDNQRHHHGRNHNSLTTYGIHSHKKNNAAEATDGEQHDTATYDATSGDADTDDADTTTATDGHERDADDPNAIWSTTTATTVEDDFTVRGE